MSGYDLIKNRVLIVALPMALLTTWLVIIAAGDSQLDALGNPVGGDFPMFYLAGNMASQGEWSSLYDEPEQQRRLRDLFPGLPLDSYLPYRYPPHTAIALAPLGTMPYRAAHAVWCLSCILIWTGTWWALVNHFLRKSSAVAGSCWLGLAVSPLAAQTLIDGQATFWWFAFIAWCWLFIQTDRWVLAGMCLALASCKPNLMLLLGVILVIRYPKLIVGIVPTALALLALTLFFAGPSSLITFLKLGSHLATQSWSVETPYWKVQSLLSWTELLAGSWARPTHLILGLLCAVNLALWWRAADAPATTSNDRQFHSTVALSLGFLINALLNPYTPIYDLLLLSLPLFCWLSYATERGGLEAWLAQRQNQLIVACVWAGPIFSQCLARAMALPQQWMPICLLIIAIHIALRAHWISRSNHGHLSAASFSAP